MVRYRFIGTVPKFTDTIGTTQPNEIVDLNPEQAEKADYSPEFVRVRESHVGRPKIEKGDD